MAGLSESEHETMMLGEALRDFLADKANWVTLSGDYLTLDGEAGVSEEAASVLQRLIKERKS